MNQYALPLAMDIASFAMWRFVIATRSLGEGRRKQKKIEKPRWLLHLKGNESKKEGEKKTKRCPAQFQK